MLHWNKSVFRNCVAALLEGCTTLEICFNSAELFGIAWMHVKIIFKK